MPEPNKSLLNTSAVREFILEQVKKNRPGWKCTRVSPRLIKILEMKLRHSIDQVVHSHPSIGQTFKEII